MYVARYIGVLQEFVDNGGVPGNAKDTRDMKAQVQAMIDDLKKAHKLREQQLSAAAQRYKQLAEDTIYKHEQLLVAYRLVNTGDVTATITIQMHS